MIFPVVTQRFQCRRCGRNTQLSASRLSALLDGPAAITAALGGFGWRPILSTLYTAGLCTLVGYAIFNRLLAQVEKNANVTLLVRRGDIQTFVTLKANGAGKE